MFRFMIVEDVDNWVNITKRFIHLDCYYSFEYGKSFADIENGKLFAAYYEDQNTKIFYPFIRRPVPYVEEEKFDIVTPYGYGGPILEGDAQSFTRFYEIFSSYCRLNNIITETVRFHPLYKNHHICSNALEIQYIRVTTAVNLNVSLEEIRNNYSNMNKRNIKLAKKNQLTCYLAENTSENIKTFIDLYKETMNRNHASSYYYFDESYFYEQIQKTDIGETYLLFTKVQEKVIAGVMVLLGKEFAHYHLGASKTKYLDLKPNNLLFDYMIEFCKSKGSQILHLGGGYREGDGLYKFKKSFTNLTLDYYIGKKVHLPQIYDSIIATLKKQYILDENYFPLYRGQMNKVVIHT
jgi:lipid II:glycine glycyltransferase (peptidoglycan interpeptide bridge formation enzyme)